MIVSRLAAIRAKLGGFHFHTVNRGMIFRGQRPINPLSVVFDL